MKILFFTSSGPDNLEDAYLHGLRSLYGADAVDYPKKEVMYKSFEGDPNSFYGRLFTIWRTLNDMEVDRTDLESKIKSGFFDFIIFGSAHRTLHFFEYFKNLLKPATTIFLDGEDTARVARPTQKYLTFKRELQPKVWYYKSFKIIPKPLYQQLPRPKNLLPISFAVPKEKITFGISLAEKKSLLPGHIVDNEVREIFKKQHSSSETYLFTKEEDYYRNLQQSRFGITTKRGGWDCLRHYEIAANGAVMCFRDLHTKHEWCAPHGLGKMNCVMYTCAEELFKRIEVMRDDEYNTLLKGSYDWISQQTTEVKATDMLRRAHDFFKNTA
ncbi:MAG TPA: hypothetical protein VEC36_05685 [Patescibacteria group bacterium]|nr:hypothetical protein [Patescibacteria group bacterium]